MKATCHCIDVGTARADADERATIVPPAPEHLAAS
jgi:hypothetical protein